MIGLETLIFLPPIQKNNRKLTKYPGWFVIWFLGKGNQEDQLLPSPYDLNIHHDSKNPHNQCQKLQHISLSSLSFLSTRKIVSKEVAC